MQRRQRRGFAPPPHRWHQCQASLGHIAHQLVLGGHWQLPRSLVCAIMGHQKDLLSVLPRSFERIVLLFFLFGNPLSYFVGVNGVVRRGGGGLFCRPRWSFPFKGGDPPPLEPLYDFIIVL